MSVLFTALYATCPYCLLLYMQCAGGINKDDFIYFEQLQSQVWAKTGPWSPPAPTSHTQHYTQMHMFRVLVLLP